MTTHPTTAREGQPMSTEPTCRVCYAKSLTPDERARFYAEPVMTSIHLCAEHQRLIDEAIAALPPVQYVQSTTARTFPRNAR